MSSFLSTNNKEYGEYLSSLKKEIKQSRIKASLSVNKELILLYWYIGKKIVEMESKEGWGAKVVKKVSEDLTSAFPEMTGLSYRNLRYMKTFAGLLENSVKLQQVVATLPWGHITRLIDKTDNQESFNWYVQKTIENGWSRNVLEMQIDANLYERKGQAITNFKETLPSVQSDLAHEIVKSPYNFEFLSIEEQITERKIEKALIDQIRDFMLELGAGFAFVGSQYHLELGGQSYYLDLLFYNLKLRAYTVIELKTGPFKPEYAGKMNFYLNVLDGELKSKNDNPSLGIILCRDNNHITAKYALDGIQRPLGVSEYKLSQALEEKLKNTIALEKTHEKEDA